MLRSFEGFALPKGVSLPLDVRSLHLDADVRLCVPDLTELWISELADRLLATRRDLLARTPSEIAAILGRAGECFLERGNLFRLEALELLPSTSGLSPQMARAVLDGMATDWTEDRLSLLLHKELVDPEVLNGFLLRGGREVMAVGPKLTVQVVAGTVPGVSVSALIRSLLVRSPTLLKPGRGDCVLPVLFTRALREVDPALADALAVVYWDGRNDSVVDLALEKAEVVTVYGSDETVGDLRNRTPVTARFISYHHRISVGVVGRDAYADAEVDQVADAVARSIGFFDQRGCVSPQVVFTEKGGACSPKAFAQALAAAFERLEVVLPGGHLQVHESSTLHQIRGTAGMMHNRASIEVLHGGDASWTVIYQAEVGPMVSCVGRVIRVCSIEDASELPVFLAPHGPHLQTVGVIGLGARLRDLSRELAHAGVSRVSPFSSVPFPPPWWHHDGGGPLLDLVRWVDLESS